MCCERRESRPGSRHPEEPRRVTGATHRWHRGERTAGVGLCEGLSLAPGGRSEKEAESYGPWVIAVTVGALLLMAVGCGGSSDSSAGDTTATIEGADTERRHGHEEQEARPTPVETRRRPTARSWPTCQRSSAQALGAATSGSGTPDLEGDREGLPGARRRGAGRDPWLPSRLSRRRFDLCRRAEGRRPDARPDTRCRNAGEDLGCSEQAQSEPRAHRSERRDRSLGNKELHHGQHETRRRLRLSGRVTPRPRLGAVGVARSLRRAPRWRTPRSSRLRSRDPEETTWGSRRLRKYHLVQPRARARRRTRHVSRRGVCHALTVRDGPHLRGHVACLRLAGSFELLVAARCVQAVRGQRSSSSPLSIYLPRRRSRAPCGAPY